MQSLVLTALATAGCTTNPDEIRTSRVKTTRPCYVEKLGVIPVKLAGEKAMVPFAVNDVAGDAIFDTGAVVSMITPDFADAAVPKWKRVGGQTYIGGVTGFSFMQWTYVNKVKIGGLEFGYGPRLGVSHPPKGYDEGKHALLGRDFLDGKDLDIDFAHGLITVYATENCVHSEPLWDTKYTGLTMTRIEHDHDVTIPVVFEGDTIDAIVDTGTVHSMMTRKAALRAGATDVELAHDPQTSFGGITGGTRAARVHKFGEVAIGEELFKNLPVVVAETPSTADGFTMILGMDYLAHHHIWISYSTNALYIDSGEPKQAAARSSASR